MSRSRSTSLFAILAFATVAAVGGWVAGSRIQSPADVAARTAPPTPSPILVPVEERVLSSDIVTRGTARFGLPQPISIAPSSLKADAGMITTLPLKNAQLGEGAVLLTASGRPVFVLQGQVPAYRDLVAGTSGDDVLQFERALERLGFDPGPIDGRYDQQTAAAVARWYRAGGSQPFEPTPQQLASLLALERDLGEARKLEMAAANAAAAADPALDSAVASADHNKRVAGAGTDGMPLAVESERAKARHANAAAEADVAASIAERALIVLDPRQPATARAAADARLRLARAAAEKIKLEGQRAVQAAERDARVAAEQFKLAKLEAEWAAARSKRLAADLDVMREKLGVPVPVDEIVFIPRLPVRVQELTALVGQPARGPVLSVTDNQLVIDSSLPLDAAPLVKPGMAVAIDEQALGIKATGRVASVASTPGTLGVDGFHIYLEVRVENTPARLEGFSLRLTIPIQSTRGAVTAVPLSAVSLAADGTSRVQVQSQDGTLEYVVVEPGLSANGFVEVTPVQGTLKPGQLVVVGYDAPQRKSGNEQP